MEGCFGITMIPSYLYRSFYLYSRQQILLRLCSPSARKLMSSSNHSPTHTQSLRSEPDNDYDDQFPPLDVSKKKKKKKVDLPSCTPCKNLQSQNWTSSRDALSLQRNLRCNNRDQVPRRKRCALRFMEDEPNGTTLEVVGSTSTGFKHKGNSNKRMVDLASSKKSSQSPNLKYRKDRNHRISGPKNRDQSSPFDICSSVLERNDTSIKDGILVEEASRETVEVSNTHRVLRPGMVLLKDFLTHHVQVDIVKTCRELGVKPMGFYQPGYRVGSKLHLQMMCLGRNWDPETKYSDIDSKPPDIPGTFSVLVQEAIREAHALIVRESGTEDAERILPVMSPDICIVNFYSETGRLGLHQDRDESRESIVKGLPIVSLSIGDSAEFVYGDRRDVEEAEGVKLESGDVLIFGGKSRMIFHGVKSIIPNSAPMSLLNESKLRTGRLNLTFRHL